MANTNIIIRPVSPDDALALSSIYAHYVEHTAITFEYDAPSAVEFESRIRNISAKFPYIVAEQDGVPVGYAYANTFKGRRAFDWSVETSIYVHRDHLKDGVGGLLLDCLEASLARLGYINVYACITSTDVADEYQDRNSIEFHHHKGYSLIGEFRKCGYKFGRWYGIVWMEKFLSDHCPDVPGVRNWDGVVSCPAKP